MEASLFLLGAGASVEAGIPASKDMSRMIVDKLPLPARGPEVRAVHYVLATIAAAQTLEGAGAFDGVDVERLLSTIEMLARRTTHEASPFVQWDPAIERMDQAVRTMADSSGIINALKVNPGKAGRPATKPNQVTVSSALHAFIDKHSEEGQGRLYGSIERAMVLALRDVVEIGDVSSVRYLSPIIASSSPGSFVNVATLNYDRTIETLSESLGVPCDTGISTWADTGHWPPPASGVRLLKLHGSIDWVFETSDSYALPSKTVRVVDNIRQHSYLTPAVVFGEGNKLTAEGPFLDLLAEFRSALVRTNRLVVVGYSFRDNHINEMLRRWINGDRETRVVVIDPAFGTGRTLLNNDFKRELVSGLLQQPESMGSPPSLRIIEKGAGEGLIELAISDQDGRSHLRRSGAIRRPSPCKRVWSIAAESNEFKPWEVMRMSSEEGRVTS